MLPSIITLTTAGIACVAGCEILDAGGTTINFHCQYSIEDNY